MTISYLFSGQGSQFPQMGMDLYHAEPIYRETIDEASSLIGANLADPVIFAQPEMVQLAILSMSTGIHRILESELPKPAVMAGLSLGEYSALVANQMISFQEAVPLVYARSQFMTNAGKLHPGSMAAVMTTDHQLVERTCQQFDHRAVIANYNTPGQVVIGGEIETVASVSEALKAAGIRRVIPLNMSVASHTPLMAPAAVKLNERLAQITVRPSTVPVLSNTTGQPFEQQSLKQILVKQLTSPTKFASCATKLSQYQVTDAIEIGPGKVLSKFVAKTVDGINCWQVDSLETLNQLRIGLSTREINHG